MIKSNILGCTFGKHQFEAPVVSVAEVEKWTIGFKQRLIKKLVIFWMGDSDFAPLNEVNSLTILVTKKHDTLSTVSYSNLIAGEHSIENLIIENQLRPVNRQEFILSKNSSVSVSM